MKKPNTRNVLMIILAILLVSGAFLLAEYRNKQANLIYTNKNSVTLDTTNNLADLENTTDWKKILLENNSASSTKINDLTKTQEKLTATDVLARDFFARYMELRQMGGANDKLSQEELINQVLKNGMVLTTPKAYTSIDILTKSDNSTESIKQYGNQVGNIFKTYTVQSRNEAVIAKDAMEKEDPEILKELDPIVKSYKNILNALLKVRAPQDMAVIHMNLVNSVSSLLFMAEGFRKSIVDPLAGIQATSLVLKNMQSLNNIHTEIREKISSLGISYTSSEGGSIFISK
jgi:hypothetical protein